MAAGVNTPARAVVVKDTMIGPTPMEVSMVQQMFGRAGRAGQEPEGWAFLVCDGLEESAEWSKRLAEGYVAVSRMADGVADHLLGEVVRRRVNTRAQAEHWWLSTFAHYQRRIPSDVVGDAIGFLEKWRMVRVEETARGQSLAATRLGQVTSRMMIPVDDAATVLVAARRRGDPAGADKAEVELVEALTGLALTQGTPPAHQSAQIRRVVYGDHAVNVRDGQRVTAAQVIAVALRLALRAPEEFRPGARTVRGIDRAALAPVVQSAPRYWAWLAAVAPLGSVPSWVGPVAADIAARVKWVHLAPRRGHGRLLRWCERAAAWDEAAARAMFRDARRQGAARPEDLGADPALLAPDPLRPGSGGTVYAWGSKDGRDQWLRGGAGRLRVAFNDKTGDALGTGWLSGFGSAGEDR
jgi:helicase